MQLTNEEIERDNGRSQSTGEHHQTAAAQPSRSGILNLGLAGRRYLARWAQPGTVEHLRVNVRVEAGSNGSGRLHVETLDLYSPRSRKVFATRAAKIFEAPVEAIEDDLSELLVAVDRVQRNTALAARAEAADEPIAKDHRRRASRSDGVAQSS